MPDIALVAVKDSASGYPSFDIELSSVPALAGAVARDVTTDSGLNTAIYLSLFTDARASVDEVRDSSDRRGWWGDEFGAFGSKLWLLTREKITAATMVNAKAYAEDALAWMVDAGISKSVMATVEQIGIYSISIFIRITKPDNASLDFRYALNWAAVGA